MAVLHSLMAQSLLCSGYWPHLFLQQREAPCPPDLNAASCSPSHHPSALWFIEQEEALAILPESEEHEKGPDNQMHTVHWETHFLPLPIRCSELCILNRAVKRDAERYNINICIIHNAFRWFLIIHSSRKLFDLSCTYIQAIFIWEPQPHRTEFQLIGVPIYRIKVKWVGLERWLHG